MPNERSQQSGGEDNREDGQKEVKGWSLLNVIGGRDAHVEKQILVSHTAIARVRKHTGNGIERVIRDGGRSGLLATFTTDIDSEPKIKRGLVQTVFIPDDLELPAPQQVAA